MKDPKATREMIDPQLLSELRAATAAAGVGHSNDMVARALRAIASELDFTLLPLIDITAPPMSERYFAQAWDMWPVAGRRRSSKTKAKDKFLAISFKIGPQRLLDAINRYVLSPDAEKDDGAYTPALDRWLTQGRWEVWLEDVAPKRVGFV